MKGARHGLYKCILGGRADMRAGSDFNGKDKDAAWKNYGTFGMQRRRAGRITDL